MSLQRASSPCYFYVKTFEEPTTPHDHKLTIRVWNHAWVDEYIISHALLERILVVTFSGQSTPSLTRSPSESAEPLDYPSSWDMMQ